MISARKFKGWATSRVLKWLISKFMGCSNRNFAATVFFRFRTNNWWTICSRLMALIRMKTVSFSKLRRLLCRIINTSCCCRSKVHSSTRLGNSSTLIWWEIQRVIKIHTKTRNMKSLKRFLLVLRSMLISRPKCSRRLRAGLLHQRL